ncbi:sensor domain-containing diguanylate cyclase [Psychromonas sp. 14N.309.X.WAT.B.A12]|uniref:sensor domain-containing diguanylate cyclase n=1 Tax=unclassified Psychromonas TaxID=2614957 RepID=UPI0025B157AF|nr:sensor domain-containing diguanylate cyclase [Psychromonas sp. 14N.309.X.WAT.B.A12]MDN2663567.1 sensor domain-containing diguanylate cyclase [Psychromonas sp. 14N.309.X.WAT.B.A12]
MNKPDIPSNEKQRLAMLRSLEVLDTLAEERFDRITRLAKRLFDVPIALVSLIDENRQWFKSCIGLDVNESPRETSFCGHAILGDDVFVIPAASEDLRFYDSPLVVDEPKVEFYAGCPLAINGFRLGTMCIADHQAREFSKEDCDILKDLAKTVELELSAMQMATHDDLTGLLNRRGFLSLAQNSLNLCNRNELPASLAYLDLDRFKAINDNFGHAVGDQVINIFAKLLGDTFRSSDVIGRLGGDEFVVLFSNTDADNAEQLMSTLAMSLKVELDNNNVDLDVCFSFGITEYEVEKHRDIQALLSDADKAMYKFKHKE